MLEILKAVVQFLDDHSTLILVIITGIYAYFTYRMAKIMTEQVVANIQVSNIVLGSNFVEDWFRKTVEQEPEKIGKEYFSFGFNLLFDVRNKNSGSGSIDKPVLILKFINDNFEYKIFPTTKYTKWKVDTNISNISEGITTDLGGTIFLRGGESQKIELEYDLYDFGDDLLKHIKENVNSLEYYLNFTDNLGRDYLIKVDGIKGKREVERR